MTARHIYLSVLFIKQGDFWVAQALEYDLAAQGRTIDDTKRAFEQTLLGQILFDQQRGREPLASLQPAPDVYWDAWDKAAATQDHLQTDPLPPSPGLPPAFMIQAFSDSPVLSCA